MVLRGEGGLKGALKEGLKGGLQGRLKRDLKRLKGGLKKGKPKRGDLGLERWLKVEDLKRGDMDIIDLVFPSKFGVFLDNIPFSKTCTGNSDKKWDEVGKSWVGLSGLSDR